MGKSLSDKQPLPAPTHCPCGKHEQPVALVDDMCPVAFRDIEAPARGVYTQGTYNAARCTRCGLLQYVVVGGPGCVKCRAPMGALIEEK